MARDTRWARGGVVVVGAVVLIAGSLAGCSSDEDRPEDASGSVAASPTPSESTSESPSASPTEPSSDPTGSPAPTASSEPPAPADDPAASDPPEQGCDPAAFTPEARVDVRRTAEQLLGFTVHSVAPGGAVRSKGEQVELFEALFSGIVDAQGAEVAGPLRAAVVERLGAGVVRDGVEELRVPLRLRNTSGKNRSYVVYAYATRSEGRWTATVCQDGASDAGPTEVRGTFAAWQRLDHGVVQCGTDPAKLSRVGQDAQLNGCG